MRPFLLAPAVVSQLFWKVWAVWGAEDWVVSILRFDYRIPSSPPLSSISISLPCYSPSSVWGMALTTEVLALLEKGAIPPAPPTPGYYSRVFVVTGGWWPVFDLSAFH